jgi:hypothetical protein
MSENTFTWKAEVEFHGTAEQFNEMAVHLNKLPVRVRIPEWPFPLPFPGLIRIPIERLREIGLFAEAEPRAAQAALAVIQGINGGIRDAHMHVGDAVVFLDRARFQKLLGETASALAIDLAAVATDYVKAATVIQSMQEAVRR